MNNQEIREYEGGDFGEIDDYYSARQIQAAIANRAQKAYETFKDVEREVEELKNNPDVVDVVATKAALDAYDTSALTDKDVVRVLADETHDGASTYYRWSASTSSWIYIGKVGDYYTKPETDTLLNTKEGKTITGAGAPTTSTEAANVGQQYYDTANSKMYYCSAITTDTSVTPNVTTYTWSEMGGGLPATTTFWGQTANNGVVNGEMTYSDGTYTASIVKSNGASGTTAELVFGDSGPVQLGNVNKSHIEISESSGDGRMKLWVPHSSILVRGSSFDFYAQTKITNVKDPTNAQDAATKNYVDNLVGDIETALNTINNGGN